MYEGQPLDRAKLRAVLNAYTIISFNGINFDLPIAFAAIAGADCAKLKEICDSIISNGDPHWKTNQKFSNNNIGWFKYKVKYN